MTFSLRSITISAFTLTPEFLLDRRMFAATDQGLLISKNGGETWENALASQDNLQPFAVTSVITTQGKDNQTVILAGVSGGFLRSDDAGQTWNYIQLPSPQPLVTALTISKNKVLYAGTAQDGVFLSKDAGITWARWNFGLLDWHIFSISTASWSEASQIVYAGSETGVFYSKNQGRTWRETNFPIDDGAVIAISSSSHSAGDLVIASTETGHLYRSPDRGISWERCDGDLFEGEINPVVTIGNQVLAICAGKLMHSLDSGLHWKVWDYTPKLPSAVLSLAHFQESDSEMKVYTWLADGSIQVLDFHL